MRAGLVLVELMLVVAVAGLVAMFAGPRLFTLADAAAVRDETLRLVGAIDAGRGAAVRMGTVATLRLSGGSYQVTAVVDRDTLVAWQQPGPDRSGVTVTGPTGTIDFGPDGLALGVANRTLLISKGSAVRRVVMSKLGRLTY